jgi:hypothetical protein
VPLNLTSPGTIEDGDADALVWACPHAAFANSNTELMTEAANTPSNRAK